MSRIHASMRRLALATIAFVPLGAVGVSAQETDTTATQQAQTDSDPLVASVGDAEIRTSDLRSAMQQLPQSMRQQSMQVQMNAALEQVLMREMILQDAGEEMRNDPEVTALIEEMTQQLEEGAVVQVWLQRRLDESVTDEAVQQAYDQAVEASDQDLPPLEQVRPQIEQQVRQQALAEVRDELRTDAEITYYDASGNPVDPEAQAAPSAEQGETEESGAEEGTDTQ